MKERYGGLLTFSQKHMSILLMMADKDFKFEDIQRDATYDKKELDSKNEKTLSEHNFKFSQQVKNAEIIFNDRLKKLQGESKWKIGIINDTEKDLTKRKKKIDEVLLHEKVTTEKYKKDLAQAKLIIASSKLNERAMLDRMFDVELTRLRQHYDKRCHKFHPNKRVKL
jgi:hypothetical protein